MLATMWGSQGGNLPPSGVAKSNEGRTHHSEATTSDSLASVAIGTADADRLVVVSVAVRDSDGGATSFDAITIGGVSATIHAVGERSGSSQRMTCVASAIVPTGTTATVACTLGAGTPSDGITVAAWALYDCAHVQSNNTDGTGPSGAKSCTLTGVVAGNYLIAAGLSEDNLALSGAGVANQSQVGCGREEHEVADNFNAAGGSMQLDVDDAYCLVLSEFG